MMYAVQMWLICPYCKYNLDSPSCGNVSSVWTGEELARFAGKQVKHSKCGHVVSIPEFLGRLNYKDP